MTTIQAVRRLRRRTQEFFGILLITVGTLWVESGCQLRKQARSRGEKP